MSEPLTDDWLRHTAEWPADAIGREVRAMAKELLEARARIADLERAAAASAQEREQACAAAAAAWRPIETAPKTLKTTRDGKPDSGPLLLLCDAGGVFVGYFSWQPFHKRPRPFWCDRGGYGSRPERTPTHWIPLPEPPHA